MSFSGYYITIAIVVCIAVVFLLAQSYDFASRYYKFMFHNWWVGRGGGVLVFYIILKYSFYYRQWGTADAEIKVPSVENPAERPSKPGIGQNIATNRPTSPTARSFFFVPVSSFPVPGHLPTF